MPPHLSLKSRLGYGCALPTALFVAWQFLLLGYIGGLGGFGGMVAMFAAFFIVPAVAVLDLWVLAPRWRRPLQAFAAGLALPAAAGLAQGVLFDGMARQSRWVEAFAAHPLAILALAPFVLPLPAAIVFAARRRRRERSLHSNPEN